MDAEIQCPVCNAPAKGGHYVGDSTIFVCPNCGGYRLAGTVMQLIENGTIRLPDPDIFRGLVAKKRGTRSDYPTITSYDLGG